MGRDIGVTAPRAPARPRGVVERVRQAVREDAERKWGVPARLGELLFVLPVVVGVLAAFAMLREGFFLLLTNEDSILEWIQFTLFGAAAVIVLLIARRRWAADDRRGALALLAVAAGVVFIAGEEISWGQRILGFETPERLEDVNRQEEFTLHNIGIVRFLLKMVALGVGLAGAILPWVARARGWGGSSLVPPLFLSSPFVVLFLYNVARAVLYPGNFFLGTRNRPELFVRYSEWTELGLAYVALVFAFLVWRRGQSRVDAAPAPPPASR